jgi:Uri superfamily endonuclease
LDHNSKTVWPFDELQGLNKGTYVMILELSTGKSLQIGRLGTFAFPAGCYAYVGSARGPGGLAGRLRRHLRLNSRAHWHVDYLRRVSQVTQVWFDEQEACREHVWATSIGELAGAVIPARRFGASDCNCPAHLFHFNRCPSLGGFRRRLRERFPADPLCQAIACRVS